MISKECLTCKKVFQSYPSARQKYCSQNCSPTLFNKGHNRSAFKGKKIPDYIIEAIRKANTGRTPWNKGTKGVMIAWNKGGKNELIRNEKHPAWKGNLVSYTNLHTWVTRKLGKPTRCEHCGKDGLSGKQIHWANKTGNYLRDLTDWLRLCARCHRTYDKANGLTTRY